MFKKDNRCVTRGVNEEVDIRLQLIMWSMIDKLKDEGKVEQDYLQVFNIRKEGKRIVINQSQEVPEYSCTYEIELEDIQIEGEIKVYVIDSGEYSTMLFPSEY
jgi:predicted transcriptional regulator